MQLFWLLASLSAPQTLLLDQEQFVEEYFKTHLLTCAYIHLQSLLSSSA